MKFLPILFALPFFLSVSSAEVVYGQLKVPANGQSESVTVNAGETFQVIGKGQFVDRGYVHFDALDQPQPALFEVASGAYSGAAANDTVLVGPCTVYFQAGSSIGFVMYKITKPDTSMLSNVVTLSSSTTGWNVQLETSTDLKNWTAVTPGSFNGDPDLQFFRVKAVQIQAP